MKVITYIYKDFTNEISSTHRFRESCARFGYEVVNLCKDASQPNLGDVLRGIYETVKELPPDEVCMYADGADNFFVRPIESPGDHILYMTEKGLWPNTEEMAAEWERHFQKYPPQSPWKYINGGAWIGPAGLAAEWYEQTGLNNVGKIAIHNSQRAQALAYMEWKEKGGPIQLDDKCIELQTIGFADDSDFVILKNGEIVNTITKTAPALFHGNGRTKMGWVYDSVPNNTVQHA